MRLGTLRPVGELVPVFPAANAPGWPSGYDVTWFESGTGALAVAVRVAMEVRRVDDPTVLIPAYTCPDVVSAVLWAGARPVVVDTCPESPWLSHRAVGAALAASTVAIVAPHFMGLRQPLRELSELCRQHGAILIEDSAQLSVASPAFAPEADLVVLSFGRGKPVPARGGALLSVTQLGKQLQGQVAGLDCIVQSRWAWRAEVALQNLAMTRLGYQCARKLPSLGVGVTRYRPLTRVRLMTGSSRAMAERVIGAWDATERWQQLVLRQMLKGLAVVDLPKVLGWDERAPLLRYPVLAADIRNRDAMVRQLLSSGIGASPLYGVPLVGVPDIPRLDVSRDTPNARMFAARLMVLPAHSGVRNADLEAMRRILAQWPYLERDAEHRP